MIAMQTIKAISLALLDAASRFEQRPSDDEIDDLLSRRSLVALF